MLRIKVKTWLKSLKHHKTATQYPFGMDSKRVSIGDQPYFNFLMVFNYFSNTSFTTCNM